MRNRILFAGSTVALTAAVIAVLLARADLGPSASRADSRPATISIEDLHRLADHSSLQVQEAPAP
jgi:hypothetical protein